MNELTKFLQSASNAAASNVSGPVDLIAAALRAAGVPVPRNALLSSEWMAERGLTVPVEQGASRVAGETFGLLAPVAAAAKAPQIASGLLKMGENAAAPRAAGMKATQRGALDFGPRAEALRTAQRNAAKPVSEGGLGLPPNNTAADRARAMGFDTDAYHATGADFSEFIPHPYRGAVSVAATPQGAVRGGLAGAADNTGSGASHVMPLVMRSDGVQGLSLPKPWQNFAARLPKVADEAAVDELMKAAPRGSYWSHFFDEVEKAPGVFEYVKKPSARVSFADVQKTRRGADSFPLPNWGDERWVAGKIKSEGGTGWLQADEAGISASVVDPSILRSRFAAFDPARIKDRDILAGLAAMGLLSPLAFQQEESQ